MSGYAYYSGPRFAIYAQRLQRCAGLRGGRYDEVGAVFGRNRPAVGFSLDLKSLAEVCRAPPAAAAIRAPWGEDRGLRAPCGACASRARRWSASCPAMPHEGEEFECDRELCRVDGRWACAPAER
jgi:ATP phosphoribosyltransferase regulatory subunit